MSLRVRQRLLFLPQFEKDLSFFKLFFLLANKSRMVRHMGILWAADGPAAQIGLRRILDTQDALRGSSAQCVECDSDLDPDFCRIVSDGGRHEAESCGRSDLAAEQRCREAGCTQIYTCNAGLTDIGVPVISGNQYIATLLAGQVLREPPSEAGFEKIRRDLASLAYIDFRQLEAAYWRVPVSSDEQIRNVAQLLEAFAEYLATSWGRLSELVEEQHRTIRETELLEKEFAHLALDGMPAERAAIEELLDRLGFTAAPNRVLVVKVEAQPDASSEIASTAAWQAVQQAGESVDNVAPAWLRKQGICVFFHDHGAQAHTLAQRIREAVESRSGLRARVGIGGVAPDTLRLAQSYDEACLALAQSQDPVCVYRSPEAPLPDLAALGEKICSCLLARQLDEAQLAIQALPLLVRRRLGESPESLAAHRQFFSSTLLSMCISAKQLGADAEAIDRVRASIGREVGGGAPRATLEPAWQRFTAAILAEVRKLYATRQDKLVGRACRLIDRSLERAERISSSQVAQALGISVSHLGRTFKQATGFTFERFVMNRRVDFARRLLLDPTYNVSQVAQKCGFSDPAYFTRVFRQVAGCTPKAYMQDPLGCAN